LSSLLPTIPAISGYPYGGVAGQQYDQCYHLGCDRLLNLSNTALDQMSDAMAHATITLSMSTQALSGERAGGNLKAPAFRLPQPRKLAG
jgi:hypothetical protein